MPKRNEGHLMTGEYDIETPALWLNVYEHGRRVARIPCESQEDAARVIEQWEDAEGIEWELEDFAARHDALDVLAPEPEDAIPEEEYRGPA